MTTKIISKWYTKDVDDVFDMCKEVLISSKYSKGIKENKSKYILAGRTSFLSSFVGRVNLNLSTVKDKTKVEIKFWTKGMIDFGITRKQLESFERSLDEALS